MRPTERSDRVGVSLGVAQGVLLATVPVVAVVVAAVAQLRERRRPDGVGAWAVVAAPLAGLALVLTALGAVGAPWLVGEAIFIVVAGALIVPRRGMAVGLVVGIMIVTAVGILQRFVWPEPWHPVGGAIVVPAGPLASPWSRVRFATASSSVVDSWDVSGSGEVRLAFGARIAPGPGASATAPLTVIAWWPGGGSPSKGQTFTVGADDTRIPIEVKLPDPPPSTFGIVVRSDADHDVVFELGRPEIVAAPGPSPLRRAPARRATLLAGQFNLAGASIGSAMMGLVTLVPTPLVVLAGLGGAAAGTFLTGSRAAVAAILLGLPAVLLILERRRRRMHRVLRMALRALLFAAVGAAVVWTLVSRATSTAGEYPRTAIWKFAVKSFTASPWSGVSGEGATFGQAWSRAFAGTATPAISHAHNLELQFAASFGIPGLVAIFTVLGLLVWLAWRRGRWFGLVVLLPMVWMNQVDYTLFFPGVLVPLILGVNAVSGLRERIPAVTAGPTWRRTPS